MRTTVNKIIISIFLSGLFGSAYALDTSSEEAACSDIGFKKKTESFANCVLELLNRKAEAGVGSNDPDDATCKKYGFKSGTGDYAICRQQIDIARQQAQRQDAQYAEQQRQYQAQMDEYQKQRNAASGLALMQMGAGISSGAYNATNGYGTLPVAPTPPQNLNRTYVLPGGKMMNCTTTGAYTSCF